jgi:hypothetical protein
VLHPVPVEYSTLVQYIFGQELLSERKFVGCHSTSRMMTRYKSFSGFLNGSKGVSKDTKDSGNKGLAKMRKIFGVDGRQLPMCGMCTMILSFHPP